MRTGPLQRNRTKSEYDDTMFRVVITATSSDPKYNRTFVQKRLKVNTLLANAPTNVSRTFLNATALIVAWDGKGRNPVEPLSYF